MNGLLVEVTYNGEPSRVWEFPIVPDRILCGMLWRAGVVPPVESDMFDLQVIEYAINEGADRSGTLHDDEDEVTGVWRVLDPWRLPDHEWRGGSAPSTADRTTRATDRESIKLATLEGVAVVVEQSEVDTGYNLRTLTPNLRLMVGATAVLLTWDEARAVAGMLQEVADTSEFG